MQSIRRIARSGHALLYCLAAAAHSALPICSPHAAPGGVDARGRARIANEDPNTLVVIDRSDDRPGSAQ